MGVDEVILGISVARSWTGGFSSVRLDDKQSYMHPVEC